MTDERWVGACWMRAYWMEVSRVNYWLLIVGRVYPLIVSTSCAAFSRKKQGERNLEKLRPSISISRITEFIAIN